MSEIAEIKKELAALKKTFKKAKNETAEVAKANLAVFKKQMDRKPQVGDNFRLLALEVALGLALLTEDPCTPR